MRYIKSYKDLKISKDLFDKIPLDINPSKKMISFLKELDTFNLNKDDYAIFGSGPLAIRGIIEPSDLDVLIKQSVYPYDKSPIVIGNIEFSYDWPGIEDTDELIDSAEVIEGHPFVKLEHVQKYKNQMGREKDNQHLINLASDMLIKYIKDIEKKEN